MGWVRVRIMVRVRIKIRMRAWLGGTELVWHWPGLVQISLSVE